MASKKDTGLSVFNDKQLKPNGNNRAIMALTITVLFACILLLHPHTSGVLDYPTPYGSPSHVFGHAILGFVPNVVSHSSKTHSPDHFSPIKKNQLHRNSKRCGADLSVFKGREARLNHAIFQTLAIKGPQSMNHLQKQLRKQKDLEGTYYASLTKRIHCLEKAGYIKQATTENLQGSKAVLYELCPKAYLAAFLNYHSPELLLSKVTDKDARIILSDLIQAVSPN